MLWVLIACLSPGDPPLVHVAAEITPLARPRAAADPVAASDEIVVLPVPGSDLEGSFDAAGARLVRRAESVTVRTRAWGRQPDLQTVPIAPPRRDTCARQKVLAGGACVERLEYERGGLTEWWRARPEGLEQGWLLASPPSGHGPLVIELDIGGTATPVASNAAHLEGADGSAWRVSGLAAWDAHGTALSARFEPAPGGLRVIVDDAGATYPVEIDPVYTTAATTLSTGSSRFGSAVAAAGDVDGDGHGDIIVGDYAWREGEGWSAIFLGSADGVSMASQTRLKVTPGAGEDQYFGASVAGAGDVNGDGYADVIVGAPLSSDEEAGQAFVLLEPMSGEYDVGTDALTGDTEKGWFGSAVSGAGDVNGDGYDDVIIGAPGDGDLPGRAYVYPGSATGVAALDATTLAGEHAEDEFASSVAGAGDVDGDGYHDVVVGAPGVDGEDGAAYVYMGSSIGVATSAAVTLSGDSSSERLGASVAGGGDVNGDGNDDVVVGAPYYSPPDGPVSAGRVYLYLGATSGPSDVPTTTLLATEELTARAYFGSQVSSAGDVNRDGYDDVVVLADGEVYVFQGSVSGVSSTASTALLSVGDVDPRACGGAGDVNGDGYADILTGAIDLENSEGLVTVHHGYADGGLDDADGDGYAAIDDCDDADDEINAGATDAPDDGVDQDCDGADASVGAPSGEDSSADDSAPADSGSADEDADKAQTTCGCAATGLASPVSMLWLACVAALARRRGVR